MTSKIRFYTTFVNELILSLSNPALEIRKAVRTGLQSYGEEDCTLFNYTDGVVIMELVSDRSSEVLKDIVCESLLEHITTHESDFDVEIDLDVEGEFIYENDI